jgi:hypothetical protein
MFNIQNGIPLDKKHKDHLLSGKWSDYRELHILNDWLLVTRILDKKVSCASHADFPLSLILEYAPICICLRGGLRVKNTLIHPTSNTREL